MKAEDILGLLVPVTFVFFFVSEKLFPRRKYPPIRFWNLIGFGCLIMTGLISTFLPLLLPASVTQYHLVDGTRLGLVGGVLVAYPLSALGAALLHRAFHKFHPLWLLGHQMHHSPRRLDIPGSVYFHPVDLALQVDAVFALHGELIHVGRLANKPISARVHKRRSRYRTTQQRFRNDL